MVVEAAPAAALVVPEADLLLQFPQCCRATPTECLPFLGKLVSSTIQYAHRPVPLDGGQHLLSMRAAERNSLAEAAG